MIHCGDSGVFWLFDNVFINLNSAWCVTHVVSTGWDTQSQIKTLTFPVSMCRSSRTAAPTVHVQTTWYHLPYTLFRMPFSITTHSEVFGVIFAILQEDWGSLPHFLSIFVWSAAASWSNERFKRQSQSQHMWWLRAALPQLKLEDYAPENT